METNICLKPTFEQNTVLTECVPKQCINVAIWEGNGFKEHEMYWTVREGRLSWDGDILYPRCEPQGLLLGKSEHQPDGSARSLRQDAARGRRGARRGGARWRPSCGRRWSGGCGTWASPPSSPNTPRYGSSWKPGNKPYLASGAQRDQGGMRSCARGFSGSINVEVLAGPGRMSGDIFLVALTLLSDPPPFLRSLRSGSPTPFPWRTRHPRRFPNFYSLPVTSHVIHSKSVELQTGALPALPLNRDSAAHTRQKWFWKCAGAVCHILFVFC